MAGGGVRAVACRGYLVLGLAAAAFAVYALSFDPGMFQQLQLQQMIKDSGRQPEQGQADCAATAAEAMAMRADAALLLLWGPVLALNAIAAVAAPSRFNTVSVQFLGLGMAMKFADVLTGVLHVTIGRCFDHGSYHRALVFGYAIVALHSFMLFFYSLGGVAPFSKVVSLLASPRRPQATLPMKATV